MQSWGKVALERQPVFQEQAQGADQENRLCPAEKGEGKDDGALFGEKRNYV